MHVWHRRQWVAIGLTFTALGATGALSCAHRAPDRVYPLAGHTKCNASYNSHAKPIPLPADAATLQANFPGCLSEIAQVQFADLATNADNNKPLPVPADPNCWTGDATTDLRVGEYDGAGRLNGMYGNGNVTSYIVGRIENTGRCPTAGKIVIPPTSVVLWIVERTEVGGPLRAHLVYQGAETNLSGHFDWEFGSCGHTGRSGDKAKYKDNVCDDSTDDLMHQEVSIGSAQAVLRVPLRMKRGPDDSGLWLVCGADCCYTTNFI
jgi:hypothetical protein